MLAIPADASANGYSGTNYTDRKGPCPDGYHVPSAGEWGGLITARHNANSSHGGNYNVNGGLSYINWYASDLAKFQADTKLPLAGYRSYSSASAIYNQGSYGYYRSSSPYPGAGYARILFFTSSLVRAFNYDYRGFGFSVRCFKNSAF